MAYSLWQNSLTELIEIMDIEKYNFCKKATYGARCYPNQKEFKSKHYDDIINGKMKYEELIKSNDYIYNGDAKDPTVQPAWQGLSSKQMDRWLGLLNEKFSFVFKQWCDENKARIDASDDAKDEYYAYFEKILGGKMRDETRNHRIRQVLFSKLKQNMKQVIEFEYV